MRVTVLVLGQHVGVFLKKLDHLHQQVVEIDGIAPSQLLLIAFVDLDDRVVPVAVGFGSEARRCEVLALGIADSVAYFLRAILPGIVIQVQQALLDQALLVFLVVDHEIRFEADRFTALTQDAGADGVKGAHGEVVGDAGQQLLQPLLHFPGSLIGKCHRHYVLRAHSACLDQVGDAVCDDARLAAAGPCQYQQRPPYVLYRFLLGRIKSVQDIHIFIQSCLPNSISFRPVQASGR